MGAVSDFQRKSVSSDKLRRQIVGALLEWRPVHFFIFVILITPLSAGVSHIIAPGDHLKCLCLICLNTVVWLTIKVCRRLLDVFSLRKKDTAITWSYITILLAIGIWIVSFLLIYNTEDDGRVATAVGAISAIVSFIFKDKIKGVVAFLHLRMHHLLNVGDWIQVPDKNVDGEVKEVTLTSVTICNWDTTTSVIPVSLLHEDHFINFQNMMEGKTYGRRMYKTFVLDTGWFHPLSGKEAEYLLSSEIKKYLPQEEIKEGVLNAHLYRIYLYHWFMNHPHISQHPRLIIRWMEQVENGMPLQIYAFITDSGLVSFEWQQSQIIEHVIESLDWFGLRLYQSPSSYDVSNSNVYLDDHPATYRKEF
jgi:miniconductance mechanosensitive channel